MSDNSFKKRLNLACDKNSEVPPYGRGKQTWVKERMGVSHEAVRKWFNDESRPRPGKMLELATLLKVDAGWLATGVSHNIQASDRRVMNAAMPGATNLYLGLLQLNSSHCAVPAETDPAAEYVSFYAIKDGAQKAYHIALSERPDGALRFALPTQYAKCCVIGVIPIGQLEVDFLSLSPELIGGYGKNQGGYVTLDLIPRPGVSRAYLTSGSPECVLYPLTKLV